MPTTFDYDLTFVLFCTSLWSQWSYCTSLPLPAFSSICQFLYSFTVSYFTFNEKSKCDKINIVLSVISIPYVKSARMRSFSGPYIVCMRENTDQNNCQYGHFLRSDNHNLNNIIADDLGLCYWFVVCQSVCLFVWIFFRTCAFNIKMVLCYICFILMRPGVPVNKES